MEACAKVVLVNKTLSGALMALLLGLLAMYAVPTDDDRIARALASRPSIPMPTAKHFVHRLVIDEIVEAANSSDSIATFLVVEGGNRAGKSTAVRAAAARLSAGRTVLWSACTSSSTADTVLQRLFGLQRNLVVDYLSNLMRVAAGPPAEVQELVLARAASVPEPVLVVERAELLPLQELKRLVDFAKELVDADLGRFIFVFSPSDKLAAVSAFGAISRASIIPVLDLTRSEALEMLGHFCTPERATSVYTLLGGHLPHLMGKDVRRFCAGALDVGELQTAFSVLVRNKLRAVDLQLGCTTGACACKAACAVLREGEKDSSFLASARPLLLGVHLIRSSLNSGLHIIDAPFVRSYLQQNCLHCTDPAAEEALALGMA